MRKISWMKYGFWINFLTILSVIAILMKPKPLIEKTIDDHEIQLKLLEWQKEDLFRFKKVEADQEDGKSSNKKEAQVYLLNRDGEVFCLEKKDEANRWLKELLEKS